MGIFYIQKTARGVQFLLRSETGRALIRSTPYATLDACKKGIASLIVNAPHAPVRDLSLGERGANPKFEITGGEGAFVFSLKSPNGKCVVTSPPYATRKACLRAISMLRLGVTDYGIVMEKKEETVPLVIDAQLKQQSATAPAAPAVEKPVPTDLTEDKPVPTDLTEEKPVPTDLTEDKPAPAAPAVEKPTPAAPAVEKPVASAPRVVRVGASEGVGDLRPPQRRIAPTGPAPRPKKPAPPKKQSFLEWLLKK